jgi:hypothetical protein
VGEARGEEEPVFALSLRLACGEVMQWAMEMKSR